MNYNLNPEFMIIPSMSCMAGCNYCFGPFKGPVMTQETAKSTVAFIKSIASETNQKNILITFHGGEPLMAPYELWTYLLKEIKNELTRWNVRLNLQSNLWNLDDKFASLLRYYNVTIGTSIDGPEAICDANRGNGYWQKTMKGIKLAREHFLDVGAIATISNLSKDKIRDIADFFKENHLSMGLHAAVEGLNGRKNSLALQPGEYAEAIEALFPWYIRNSKNIQCSTLDNFVRSFVQSDSGTCTFKDCFGMFMAIGPEGNLFPCQRFCGNMDFTIGNIFQNPSLKDIYTHPNAQKILLRQKQVKEECGDCSFYNLCKGGCFYNSLSDDQSQKDPLCASYQQLFSFVQQKILEESATEANINAIVEDIPKYNEHPMLRRGPYISLGKKVHPSNKASNARAVLAVHELAKTNDPLTATENLLDKGICKDQVTTEKYLNAIHQSLSGTSVSRNNVYVHTTFSCNLHCTHCYASAEQGHSEMAIENFRQLLRESINHKFRQFIITGGEPLIHSEVEKIMDICASNRFKGIQLVLRTNFSSDLSDDFLIALAHSFDQIVASLDGNEQTHDHRRGRGTYQKVVRNLRRYQKLNSQNARAAKLSIACVMNSSDINGAPGVNVRKVADELGISRVRFRPVLPVGRAKHSDEPIVCEAINQHISEEELFEASFQPTISCGMGSNLYIEPDGNIFPCYAYHQPHSLIGNIFEKGFEGILNSDAFGQLASCNVNNIKTCKECEYRYLCGGACKAWGDETNQKDLLAAPANCDHLRSRAERTIKAAYEYLLDTI